MYEIAIVDKYMLIRDFLQNDFFLFNLSLYMYPRQQFFNYFGMGLPGLNQY